MNPRYLPPVCLFTSIGKRLTGRLVYNHRFVGRTVETDDGERFEIFRHIHVTRPAPETPGTLFLVRFKFSALSHNINRFISRFPMLLITGRPGFQAKMYAVNRETGYWMGLYQWASEPALEAYKRSFVLNMMDRRAAAGTVRYTALAETRLSDYVEAHLVPRADK